MDVTAYEGLTLEELDLVLEEQRQALAGFEEWESIEDIKSLGSDSPKAIAYRKSANYRWLKGLRSIHQGHKCDKCGRDDTKLDLHHVHYDTYFKESLKDVRLLCRETCHKIGHKAKSESYELIKKTKKTKEKHMKHKKDDELKKVALSAYRDVLLSTPVGECLNKKRIRESGNFPAFGLFPTYNKEGKPYNKDRVDSWISNFNWVFSESKDEHGNLFLLKKGDTKKSRSYQLTSAIKKLLKEEISVLLAKYDQYAKPVQAASKIRCAAKSAVKDNPVAPQPKDSPITRPKDNPIAPQPKDNPVTTKVHARPVVDLDNYAGPLAAKLVARAVQLAEEQLGVEVKAKGPAEKSDRAFCVSAGFRTDTFPYRAIGLLNPTRLLSWAAVPRLLVVDQLLVLQRTYRVSE